MASVLAIGPNVRKFNPGRGDCFLRTIKIRSTPSFEGEVKPMAPCRKFILHEKSLENVNKDNSKAKFIISFAILLLLCY
jgi:hypothetical protein